MDKIKINSNQIIKPKLIYISISVVIGLVVISILTFAIFANYNSQKFAVSTFNTLKGNMQSSEQGYNTLLTIFENQYSSFVSSLALVLSIFTITISIAATVIPFLSTKKELDAMKKEFNDTKKAFEAMTTKQNAIQNAIEMQRNELFKIISEQSKLDNSVKNVKSIGILMKQSLLAYRALNSNRIAEFEYYYNHIQGLYK